MSERLVLRLSLRLTRERVLAALAAAALLAAPGDLASETVAMTTLYPSPSGVYTSIMADNSAWLSSSSGQVSIGTTSSPAGGVMLRVDGNAYVNGGHLLVNNPANTTWSVEVAGGTGNDVRLSYGGSSVTMNLNPGASPTNATIALPGGGATDLTGNGSTVYLPGGGAVGIGYGAPTTTLDAASVSASGAGCTLVGGSGNQTLCSGSYVTMIPGWYTEYQAVGAEQASGAGGRAGGSPPGNPTGSSAYNVYCCPFPAAPPGAATPYAF